MVDARPVQGFGPNNFYANYERFTVTGFQTWVSDNPDRSGIHNYYLMTAVEQGLPGLAIYLVLIVFVMLYAEKVYLRARDPLHRSLVMTAISSLVVIHLLQTMNDLVETDKVGPFFFLAMALIVSVDRWERQGRPDEASPEGPGIPRSDGD
jgi:O-antigen ligase